MHSFRTCWTGTLGHADRPEELIRELARATGGNMTDVAFLLGVRREWLYKQMHDWGIFNEIQQLCNRLTRRGRRVIIEGETYND